MSSCHFVIISFLFDEIDSMSDDPMNYSSTSNTLTDDDEEEEI